MTRRLMGPVGGPIALFLVAGLVFAGLGWVTVAALRVEEAQREAARSADREKLLRIALWRLDARMLPALGVEDTRQFHEFKSYTADDPVTVYGPASAPLLVGDLPEWMQLHFQMDPEAAWESPQVLSATQKSALRRHWPEMPLRNATKTREVQLATLNEKFPAKQVGEMFALRERSYPVVTPVTPPASHTSGAFEFQDSDGVSSLGREPERLREKAPAAEDPKPIPVSTPAAPADAKPGAGAGLGADAEAFFKEQKQKDVALAIQPPAIRKAAEPEAAAPPQAAPQPAAGLQAQNGFTTDSAAKALDGKKRMEPSGLDFDIRQSTVGSALREVARLPYSLIPRTGPQNFKKQVSEQSKSNDTASRASKKLDDLAGGKESEFARNLPNADMKKVESDPYAFNRLLNEARTRARELEQADKLHRGDLNHATDKKEEPKSTKDAGDRSLAFGGAVKGATAPPPAGPGLPPAPGGPAAGAFPRPKALAAPGGGPAPGLAGGGGLGSGGPPAKQFREAIPPTPDPAPPAMLIPVEPPPVPLAATDDFVAAPLAVHLGTLRPQWLTAPDGTPLLVLVRAARIENRKTVYQGVVLDWAKLQALLHDEVKDLFPDANLEPVKDAVSDSREQSMTALPVRLEPGAESPPPPAGWTPLRIGLVLAWVAAAIAFAAIGLTGWSLVGLANRRIRFVSAVTHELRTPLTSLRLYLDLLLSGMVQDEEKRQEYLSTLNVESDRLHRLIDNVLDFAKLERNRKGRERTAVKAADLLDSIRLTWMDRVAADGKELMTESDLPADLGLLTDGALVQQIVGNLIDNARKYTREATNARVWLKARVDAGKKLVIEVEDRGVGIPAREQKTIFLPFRRGDTADTKAGGAGLGLALSKEWAEALGGRLTYRTPDGGVGSCFRLELPIRS